MDRRSLLLGWVAAALGLKTTSATPEPNKFQYNEHIREFTDYRELIHAISAHVRTTGDRVLPADDMTLLPPRVGFATVPQGNSGPMCLWRISVPNLGASLKRWQGSDPRVAESFIRSQQTRAGKVRIAQALGAV